MKPPTIPGDCAFPLVWNELVMANGLTKRELFALHIYANMTDKGASDYGLAQLALVRADALITALNEPEAGSGTAIGIESLRQYNATE